MTTTIVKEITAEVIIGDTTKQKKAEIIIEGKKYIFIDQAAMLIAHLSNLRQSIFRDFVETL